MTTIRRRSVASATALAVALLLAQGVGAQNAAPAAPSGSAAPAGAAAASTETGAAPASAAGGASPSVPGGSAATASAYEAPPRVFRGYSLGMSLEDVKKALAADDAFAFRGDRDVSLLPESKDVLIETSGLSFVKSAFFLFHGDALYIMSFSLDTDRLDHYSVYTALEARYGPPAELDPKAAVWKSDSTRASLERPLTLKYVDLAVFDALKAESEVGRSREAILRQEFIDDL